MSELTPALQHSPLAKLPPELRNLIFEYAVTQLAPIFVEDKDYHNPDRRISLRATPRCRPTALTQTCKQIRDEAEPLLYACNDFVIRLPRLPTSNDQPPGARAAKRLKHTMSNFVNSLHPANSPFLRYLRIELPTADYVNQRQKLVLQVWEPLLWLSHGAAYRLPNLKIQITTFTVRRYRGRVVHRHILRVGMRDPLNDLRAIRKTITECGRCGDDAQRKDAFLLSIRHCMNVIKKADRKKEAAELARAAAPQKS